MAERLEMEEVKMIRETTRGNELLLEALQHSREEMSKYLTKTERERSKAVVDLVSEKHYLKAVIKYLQERIQNQK